MSEPVERPRPRSITELFVTFTVLALQGFGGVMAIVQRVLCEQKQWLTREEFLDTLAVAQALPGPNVCNISMMIGDRFFGTRGALAALSGMLLLPAMVVLSLASLESEFAALPEVQGALRGVAAVTAGMVVGTGVRLASALRGSLVGTSASALLGGTLFVALAWLRLPMGYCLLAVGSVAWAYARHCLRRVARVERERATNQRQSEDGRDGCGPEAGSASAVYEACLGRDASAAKAGSSR
jgi:chromate transporter